MDISEEEAFDEQYDTERNRLFELLRSNTSFHHGALRIFSDCFRGEHDQTKHGPIFWALMVKGIKDTKRVVLGSLLRIYMQYYYHYCVQSSHPPLDSMKRQLDLSSMWFIVCAASFPFDQASNEFHKWRMENNQDIFDNLVIERANFLRFFWNGTNNQFSFIGAWKIIDKLWEIWDSTDPVKILGFDTLSLSRELLHHCHQEGAFLFRFSGEGGLVVDYYHKGSLKQYHWKSESLDLHHFLTLLHNPALQYLVTISKQNEFDDQGVPVLYPKGTLFQTVDISEGMEESHKEKIHLLTEALKRYEQSMESMEATMKQQDIDFKEHIRSLQETITQKEEQYKYISIELKEQQKKTEEAMEVTTQKNLNLIQDILTRSETIATLEKQMTEFKQKVQGLEATIKSQEKELKDLKETLIQKDNYANKMKEAYNGKEQLYDCRVKEKNLLLDEKNQFNLWLTEAVREVYEGNPNMDAQDSEIPTDTKGKINLLTEKIKELRKTIQNLEDAKHEKNQTLENELAACQYSLQDLERKLQLKEESIHEIAPSHISLQDLERKLQLKEESIKDIENELNSKIQSYQKLENENKKLEGDIQEKEQYIQHLEEELKIKKKHEEELETDIKEGVKVITALKQMNQNLDKELKAQEEKMRKQLEEKTHLDLRLTEAESHEDGGSREKIQLLEEEIERLKAALNNVMADKVEPTEAMKNKTNFSQQDIASFLEENSLAIRKIQKKEARQRALILEEKNHLLHEKEQLNLMLIEATVAIHEGDPKVNVKEVIPKDTKGKISLLTEKIKELKKSMGNEKNIQSGLELSQHVEELEEETQKLKEVLGDARARIDSKELAIQNLKNELESKDHLIRSLDKSKKEDSSDHSEDEENTLAPKPKRAELVEKVTSLTKSLDEQSKELEDLRKYKARVKKTSLENKIFF